jgi:hypothetical protein
MSDDPIDQTVLEGLRLLHREGKLDIAKTVIMLFLESAPAVVADLEQGAASNVRAWRKRRLPPRSSSAASRRVSNADAS